MVTHRKTDTEVEYECVTFHITNALKYDYILDDSEVASLQDVITAIQKRQKDYTDSLSECEKCHGTLEQDEIINVHGYHFCNECYNS